MQIIYNEEEKIIICAVARCGTNYLNQIALHVNYKELDNNYNADYYSDYTVIKIVRDPFNRFVSWWYSFLGNLSNTEDHPNCWSKKQVDQWIENFKIDMHYDEHTGFQSILYYQNNNLNKNTIFVKIEDLDIVLGLSSKQRYTDSYSKNILENTVFINKLFKSVKKLYDRDINWYNQLDTTTPTKFILKFFSDLTRLDMGTIDNPFPTCIDLGTITNDLEIDVDFGKISS
jgi:hypothetical protein